MRLKALVFLEAAWPITIVTASGLAPMAPSTTTPRMTTADPCESSVSTPAGGPSLTASLPIAHCLALVWWMQNYNFTTVGVVQTLINTTDDSTTVTTSYSPGYGPGDNLSTFYRTDTNAAGTVTTTTTGCDGTETEVAFPTEWCQCWDSVLTYLATLPTSTTSNPGSCCLAIGNITAPIPTEPAVPLFDIPSAVSSVPASDPAGLLYNLAQTDSQDFPATALWPQEPLTLTYATCTYSECSDIKYSSAAGPEWNQAHTNILATTTIFL